MGTNAARGADIYSLIEKRFWGFLRVCPVVSVVVWGGWAVETSFARYAATDSATLLTGAGLSM